MTRSTLYATSYSYKGGSGRTTTTLNIAQALTALGADVVLIDADLGAGGVRSIWREMLGPGHDDAPSQGTHAFLQDWVATRDPDRVAVRNAFEKWDFWNSQAGFSALATSKDYGRVSRERREQGVPAPLLRLLDQVGEVHGLGRGQKRFAGELLVIPGAHQQYTVRGYNAADTGWIAKGYRALGQLGLEYLRETTGREASDQIVLLDSASGITPVSMPSLLAANVILVFFRMSIQHHQGTTGNLPDLFDYLDDKHGECRFEDESQRRRMQRQRVIAMATCVDSRTEDILGKLREAMPLSGAILESYTRIGDFWDYVKAESGLPVFGRAIQYGGEFAQHPILTCRETGVFFSSAYANDGEEDPVALHASQAHTEYVERCLEIATHLIKLGRS